MSTDPTFDVGATLSGPTRRMTPERVSWYGAGMLGAASGEQQLAQANIHTDPEYAMSQGLPAAIADGMHSTNWLSAMLTQYFGKHYLLRGELRTKYIKPVIVGDLLTAKATVRSRQGDGSDGVRYELDVWCEDGTGTKLTVGEAAVVVSSKPESW